MCSKKYFKITFFWDFRIWVFLGTAETYAITAVHNLMEHYGDASADELDIITTTIDETQGW